MVDRCNPQGNGRNQRDYARRGIRVCQEWQQFEPFRDWALVNGYAAGLTIERTSAEFDYRPDNCEWITLSENCRRARVSTQARARLETTARQSSFPRTTPIEMFWGA